MGKKGLLLLCFSLVVGNCFGQSDSGEVKHLHRWWINPTQIVTGKYTLAYARSTNDGRNWYGVAIGYRYFPIRALEPLDAPGGNLATPKMGIEFMGPLISIASEEFYTKVKRSMRKAAEHDTSLQKIIMNTRSRNSTTYELQYQHLNHNPTCYYRGEENDSYTYSAKMNCFTGEVLFSHSFW